MEDATLRAAEAALGEAWGASVTCEAAETLRERGRSRVYRLRVEGGPLASVILKSSIGDGDAPYIVGDPAAGSPFERLVCEWAGCALLGPRGLGPNLLGGDVSRGFCLLEDLGAGETLAERLLGDDPDAARAALFAYARSLGDMHAATAGAEAEWVKARVVLGAAEDQRGPLTDWRSELPRFKDYLQSCGVAVSDQLLRDLAAVEDALGQPGRYLAFSPNDCCPDNHFLRGDRVVFFDCEWASMRHALIDAAYFLAPFPTCWCCARMPDDLAGELIAAYRERFPGGADFDEQLTFALSIWSVARFASAGWASADRQWGPLSSTRQRGLQLLRSVLARPGVGRLLPGLVEAFTALEAHLTTAWPDLAPMPLYPAFRHPSGAP